MALLPNSTYTKNESGWVIQDEPGWPSGYFMRPLPGFMLQTVEETPQVCIRTGFCLCTIYYVYMYYIVHMMLNTVYCIMYVCILCVVCPILYSIIIAVCTVLYSTYDITDVCDQQRVLCCQMCVHVFHYTPTHTGPSACEWPFG